MLKATQLLVRTRTHIVPLLVSALIATTPAHAQAIFGSIQGTVADETGAVVPNARVVARNVDTGVESATRSNETGIYFIGELRPGNYDVEAEASGFSRISRKGVTLRVEDKLRVDFALKVGQVAETLEVTSDAPLIQTESNTIGRVVEETTIKQLPLSGRNAFQLVLLAPGTQQRRDDELPRLSGGLARTGEFVLDGSSITTPRRGQLFTQPNLDAIQEFKVQTNGLGAEVGRTAGGIVNATLKSGTNSFHGNLYDFLRNTDLNGRNFFASTVPKLIQNQYGGMIGGPIRRDHTFFFFDGEGFRTQAESLFNLTLPTTLMKQGNFSQITQQIYDPGTTRQVNGQLTRDPFAGNIIPASRFDGAGVKAIQLYPDPNRPGVSQNYQRLIPVGTDNKKFDVRIDHRLSDKDLIFGRFSFDHQYSDTARPYAASGTGGNRGNFNRYLTGSYNWTRTITPTTLNDLRFAFFRGVQERLLSLGTTDLGIPNLNVVGLPQFTVPGYDSLGDSQAFNPVEEQYQLQDVATFVRGRHIIKTGADIRRFRINDLQLQFTASFGLSAAQTALPSSPGTTGSPLASLLLGQADSFANSTLRGRFYYRSWYGGFFAQDDFKVSPTLTVNIGLRYDLEQEPHEARSQGSIFDLRAGRVTTMKELGRNYIQFTDKDNWGPRIGFAWRPFKSDKTVVRSHFGVFYIPLTGRATSAFDRFPQDQRIGITSDGINAAAIVSQPPPIVFSVDGTGFAHDTKNLHAQVGSFLEWNFDIQHQLPWSMLFQASYAASAGRHLPMNEDWNVIPIEAVQRVGAGTQAMRPYPLYGDILAHDERQTSSYNALQVGLERRASHGPVVSVSYTFSKMIDSNEDDFSSMFPMDPYNLKLERGLSQTQFPHHFVAALVYDLPWGKGRAHLNSGPLAWVLGGWQTSGIVTLQSGQQVWITQATNTARTFSRQFRPNLIGDPILPGDQRTLLRYFNTAAFQAPAPLTIGNSNKFPNIQGPGTANTDFALIRFFPLPWGEQKRLELRGEFFNLFNRANFQPPNGTFGSPTFGRVTAADPARLVQIGLKLWF